MPDTLGPEAANRFTVEIDGLTVAGFQRVDLPTATSTKAEYREGNQPAYDFPLWGQTEYSDLVLERGAKPGEMELWNWRKKVIDGKLDDARRPLAVVILDEEGQTSMRYEFKGAWPVEYQAPTLDAQAGSGIATETVVVTYEQFERVS